MRSTLREAGFAFRRSPFHTALSIATIAFALYTLGAFGLVWLNIERVLEDVESRVEVIAFLDDRTAPDENRALMQEVAGYPEVDSIAYVSKDAALARARADLEEYSDLLEDLEVNPLPASIEIALRSGYRETEQVRDVAARVARFPFVEDVRYGEDWVEKLDFLQDLALFVGLVVGSVFAAVAFVAIGATINLVLVAREDEIGIMKMVGATPGYIARPFVLEGFAKGLLGAILAALLLVGTYAALERRVLALDFYGPAELVVGLAVGGALGALASMLALNRHLRVW